MIEQETYVVHAKTDNSTMSIATEDPAEALRRAREMQNSKCTVTISDRSGNVYTIDEMEMHVSSGSYAKAASSARLD